MSKTTIIGITIVVLILGGLIWFARPRSMNEGGAARPTGQKNTANITANLTLENLLSAEETAFDFGAISMAAGDVRHAFKIKNASDKPVAISKMYTSCMCTTAMLEIKGEKIGPYGMPGHGFAPRIGKALATGEEAIVEVVFDPAAHGPAGVGRVERVVYLENDADRPLELKISAMVMP